MQKLIHYKKSVGLYKTKQTKNKNKTVITTTHRLHRQNKSVSKEINRAS